MFMDEAGRINCLRCNEGWSARAACPGRASPAQGGGDARLPNTDDLQRR
jgi:hypothetical protein